VFHFFKNLFGFYGKSDFYKLKNRLSYFEKRLDILEKELYNLKGTITQLCEIVSILSRR